MAKKKKHLTVDQEFQLMKIVLDKFLLLGVFIIALGLYLIITSAQNFVMSFSVLITGAILLIIFSIILVREYNFLQN